ncbi:MAG TPA: LamB/YcsF family protein, partial [Chitinophagaceae bacterium]|nr:LamB/YcsF family protein [Chitinophagaceae bacterium]
DGSLAPRSQPGALIEEAEISTRQVLQMIKQKTVTTLSGRTIPINADTICIHGDGKQAVAFAKNISNAIKNEGFDLRPPA